MTKNDLIDLISSKQDGMTKKAATDILDALFDAMATTIRKDEKFTYPGFGTFVVRKRKARDGIDPRTRAKIKIPASKTVGFKPAKAFKDTLSTIAP
ncbi:MAG: HU family DNA-binding protein [Deltaproteobacteria bacterium]|nr:HU family DNA-binding protein [Deltaproteobacteria bacterium]